MEVLVLTLRVSGCVGVRLRVNGGVGVNSESEWICRC